MEKISDRFAAIDGFLVKKDKSGLRRIVNTISTTFKPNKQEARCIEKLQLRNLALYLDCKDDLLPHDCPLLFKTVSSKRKLFYHTEDGIKVVKSGKTSSRDMRRAIEHAVIEIPLSGSQKKYLVDCQDGIDQRLWREGRAMAPLQNSNNSHITRTLACDTLLFTPQDYALLRSFALEKVLYEAESISIFEHCHRKALQNLEEKGQGDLLEEEITGKQFHLLLHKNTIRTYGRIMSSLYFILVNFHRLSLSTRVADPAINRALLLNSIGCSYNVESKASHLQEIMCIMLKNTDHASLLQLLARMLPFNLEGYVDKNQTLGYYETEEICERLVAMRTWVKYVALSAKTGDEEVMFLENDPASTWGVLSSYYREIARESKKLDLATLRFISRDIVCVSGKTFGRCYIRDFYSGLEQRFDALWMQLNKYYSVRSIQAVEELLFYDESMSLSEGKSCPYFSFENVFPMDVRRGLLPRGRKALTEAEQRVVLDTIEEMTRAVMWITWLAAGTPYAFAELQGLAYAGERRNVYVDGDFRRIKLATRYNQNGDILYLVKWLDSHTSSYLAFLILVISKIQLELLNEMRSIFDHPRHNEMRHSAANIRSSKYTTPIKKTCKALLSEFLFVDASQAKLVSEKRFQEVCKEYPKRTAPLERLNFPQLRQGMTALVQRKLEGHRSQAGAAHPSTSAYLADHWPKMGTGMYGLDSLLLKNLQGPTAYMTQRELSEQWNLSMDLGVNTEDEPQSTGNTLKGGLQRAGLVPDDLFLAGRMLYGEQFAFRNTDQTFACISAYMSDEKVIAVQAPTGFGKTLVFQLPLICYAMKKLRTVSFVFVPDAALVAATTHRLRSKSCLRVGSVEFLIHKGLVGDDPFQDVYVGTFSDAIDHRLIELMKHWEEQFPETQLGLLVFDEFQNLPDVESYCKAPLHLPKDIDIEQFQRLILTTATGSQGSSEKALRELGLKGRLEIQPVWGDSEGDTCFVTAPIRFRNYIREPPLAHVYKHAILMEDDGTGQVMVLLRRLFEKDSKAKAAIVLGQEANTGSLFNRVAKEFTSVCVGKELGKTEKAMKMQSFLLDKNVQVLMGSKLAVEGIDVAELRMVILLDYQPSVGEYIQCAGRVRNSGVSIALWRKAPQRINNDLSSIDYSHCFTSQICEFYELPQQVHAGCCKHFDSVSEETRDIFEYVAIELEPADTQQKRKHTDGAPHSSKRLCSPHNPEVPGGRPTTNLELQATDKSQQLTKAERLERSCRGCRDIFEYFEFSDDRRRDLLIEGLDERYFGNISIFNVNSELECRWCLEPKRGCCCWPESPACEDMSLKKLAMQALAFLGCFLTPKEYTEEVAFCENYGVATWMMLLETRIKKEVFTRYYTAYKDYHDLVRRRMEYFYGYEGDRYIDDYNEMWRMLQKKELIVYFSTRKIQECPMGGCCADCVKIAVEDDDPPWCRDYPISKGYLQAQMESTDEDAYLCSENMAMRLRGSPPVLGFHYKLMQFVLFHNKDFRDAIWERFPQLPQVGMFTHWLRLMKTEWIFDGVPVPLYAVVGAIFYRQNPYFLHDAL
ncbi:Helicase ATP-binding domain-containing protein [Lachancea thermotolerans]